MAGTITIRRERGGWRDRLRAYTILLDGREAGSLRRGETRQLSVQPGAHEVQIAVDWARSPTVAVDVAEGTEANLRCGPNHQQRAIAVITPAGSASYLSLEREA